jgi:hypothetical protein
VENERRFTNERIIQALVVMAFVIFIILIIFILLLMIKGTSSNSSNSNTAKSSGASYTYYNLTTINNYQNSVQGRVVDNQRTVVVYNDRNHNEDDESIFGKNREQLEYSSYSRHFREKDDFGSYIEEFNVYVKNEDSVGGYFQVIFYFENCYGDEFSESITKYIQPRETEKFKYKEIWYKEKGICDWDYDIFS